MANEEHLRILSEEVDAWNQWRKENPSAIPDLSAAALCAANLRSFDLHGAALHEADHFGIGLDDCAAVFGCGEEAQRHPHGVHRGVGNLDAHEDGRVDVRLALQHFAGRQAAGGNAALVAGLDEFVAIGGLFLGQGNK